MFARPLSSRVVNRALNTPPPCLTSIIITTTNTPFVVGPIQRRQNSSTSTTDPIIDLNALQQRLLDLSSEMSTNLTTKGYYTATNLLPPNIIKTMRTQCIKLRHNNRFEQSWSERVTDDGSTVRFDKKGVYACEPDGSDYDLAPDVIVYMSVLLQTLPAALSQQNYPTEQMQLSTSAFNAKLAVTEAGGSVYPLHIDNPLGVSAGDTRKLTCILYLNPDYNEEEDGGEIRLYLDEDGVGKKKKQKKKKKGKHDDEYMDVVDFTPEGGRLLTFWSDEIPHEVLPTAPHVDGRKSDDESLDRYALTVWIPTDNYLCLHNDDSKFSHLRDFVFP